MSDIARNSNVGWSTLNRLWDDLISFRIIEKTRNVGKSKLFKLNEKNSAVIQLIEVYKKLLLQETENYFSKNIKLKIKVSN